MSLKRSSLTALESLAEVANAEFPSGVSAEVIAIHDTEKSTEANADSPPPQRCPFFLRNGHWLMVLGLMMPPLFTIFMVVTGIGRLRHFQRHEPFYAHYTSLFHLSRYGLPLSIGILVSLMGSFYFGFLSPLAPAIRGLGYLSTTLVMVSLSLFYIRRCLKTRSLLEKAP